MNNVGPLESTPCEKQFDLVKGVEVPYPPRTKAATGTGPEFTEFKNRTALELTNHSAGQRSRGFFRTGVAQSRPRDR
jgi:hypothetical protein